MTAPARLEDLLDSRLDGVARIQVVHLRRSRFRWLSLVELALWLVFAVVLLCCLLVAAVVALLAEGDALDGDALFDLPKPRFRYYWHEIAFRFLGPDGEPIAEHRLAPRDAAEGEAVVGSVLAAADRECLAVVEAVGAAPRETLEVWYGGQPLMAHPERRDGDAAARALEGRWRWTVEAADDRVVLERVDPAAGRVGAFFSLLLGLALLPVLFWRAAHRRKVATAWADLKGVAPPRRRVALDRRGFTYARSRAGEVLDEVRADARDVLGIAYSATLDYDREVTRRRARLRLVTRAGAVALPGAISSKALRDYLIVSAQRLWEGLPETARPTRCPYCGGTYVFAPGVTCPSCGAPPDRL